MTTQIRTPGETDRRDVVDVLHTALNFPPRWVEKRGPVLPLDDFRCAFVNGALVATAGQFRWRHWFAGRDLPMTGIFGVATLPEHRGGGLASEVVLTILREAREGGAALSALYPAVVRPYRRLGYELAGSFTEHRLALDRIPEDLGGGDAVEVIGPDDLAAVKDCFHRFVRDHTGTIEPVDDLWWSIRVFDPVREGQNRTVGVRGDDESLEGFASFGYQTESRHLDVDFGLSCTAFVTTTARATRSLLSYFRGFRGVGLWVEWPGPPSDPVSLLVEEHSLETPFRHTWMLRLLDVPAALAGRGYPDVDGEVVIDVRDPHFPENRGPWRLRVQGGKAEVQEADEPATELGIGTLSALYSGYLHPVDAARLGLVDPGATATLGRLFAGPDPWSPFFF
jgi:predicted acetyltransferase